MNLERQKSGLLLFSRKFKPQERIVTTPDGQRVRVIIDESGTVKHVEEDDALHAIVRPNTTVLRIRRDH